MDNLALIESLYVKYCRDKESVSKDWGCFFQGFELGAQCYDEERRHIAKTLLSAQKNHSDSPGRVIDKKGHYRDLDSSAVLEKSSGRNKNLLSQEVIETSSILNKLDLDQRQKQIGAIEIGSKLLEHYRQASYLIAKLSPITREPAAEMSSVLEESFMHACADGQRIGPELLFFPCQTQALYASDIVSLLKKCYALTSSIQCRHLSNKKAIEICYKLYEQSCLEHIPSIRQEAALRSLIELDVFETFLRKHYPGEKLFLLAGLDPLIPALLRLLQISASQGVEHFVCSSTHRGRLGLLHFLFGATFDTILHELEGSTIDPIAHFSGDVKYHYGYFGHYQSEEKRVTLELLPNPSHLESVMPVLLGVARERSRSRGENGRQEILCVCIHGDAAFSGQGVVYEALSLSIEPNYRGPSTLHIILNNALGFTTDTNRRRSSHSISEIAKGFDLPILHVNAEDMDRTLQMIELAFKLMRVLETDVVLELHGYRRYGHSEIEDPTVTHPLLYRTISQKRSLCVEYGRRLIEQGVISGQEKKGIEEYYQEKLIDSFKKVKETPEGKRTQKIYHQRALKVQDFLRRSGQDFMAVGEIEKLAVNLSRLKEFLDVFTLPEQFSAHPIVQKMVNYRKRLVIASDEERLIDWATAESLAIAVALESGLYVRFSGQDSMQGTFSHRHVIWHEQLTGEAKVPWRGWEKYEGQLEVFDTPLSEYGAMGFEYGVSLANPLALVIWEAQYGDFANGAQIIIDQYIAAGFHKWGNISRLVLLLPHGQEGAGPEHSSARLERFLELSGQYNWRVCIPTTAAQYYKALIDHITAPKAPLVLLTPKKLLRNNRSYCSWKELTQQPMAPIIVQCPVSNPTEVIRIILTAGKLYYDLLKEEETCKFEQVAFIRIEQLYPFPAMEIQEQFKSFPQLKEIFWVQDEPENMGAGRYIHHKLSGILPSGVIFKLIGAEESPVTAPGLYELFCQKQENLIHHALDGLTTELTFFHTDLLT
jgi:2-oxoglutarate dehydrogenase E1 component